MDDTIIKKLELLQVIYILSLALTPEEFFKALIPSRTKLVNQIFCYLRCFW